MSRVVIRIDATTAKACAKLAKEKEITEGEAADLLIGTAVKRRAAVSKYTAKPAKKAKRARRADEGKRTSKAKPKARATKPGMSKPAKKRVRKPKAAVVAPVVEASESVEQTELN